MTPSPALIFCQMPARRAGERDEDAVQDWRQVVWLQVEALRRPGERGSSSKTNPVPGWGRNRHLQVRSRMQEVV
jgi:hypothetical protein